MQKLSRHEIIQELRRQGVHLAGYAKARKAVEDFGQFQTHKPTGQHINFDMRVYVNNILRGPAA